MPKSNKTTRVLLFGGIVFIALLVAGIATGAVGNALINSFTGKDNQEVKGIVSKPKVELPPVPVFPQEAREHFVKVEECRGHPEGFPGAVTKEECDQGPFKNNFQFLITNTLLSAWLTTLVLIGIFFIGTRRMKLVPSGLQNFCEWVVETLLTFVEGVAGKEKGRTVLPVIATIFLFVSFNAWIGLLPIYPSLGFLRNDEVEVHLLRPAGTDMNMPLALALISFVFVEFMGMRTLGLSYLSKFVRVASLKHGLKGLVRLNMGDAFQGFLDFGFVGPLEAFSEFVRIISFTFRLFGNMTAGEILVLVSAFLVSFVATVGVYGLEILVGFVQALIFSGLTLVFVTVAITPHGEEGHRAH